MLDSLQQLDQNIFLALNELHAPILDPLMMALSGKFIWVPFYMFLLYCVYRHDVNAGNHRPWAMTFTALLCIVLAIVIADQVCSSILRPIFERPRPAQDASPIHNLVHIVNGYRGGAYGFPSCHAANSMALATFISLFFVSRNVTIGMFAWALLLCYTRVYLGVHYPGDLLVGSIIGIAAGALCFRIYRYCIHSKNFSAILGNNKEVHSV